MGYGASLVDVFRQVGVYVGKPARVPSSSDFPVQQSTKFELAVNQWHGQEALGLNAP